MRRTFASMTLQPDPKFDLRSVADLQALFDAPKEVSLLEELDHVGANYAEWIAASPFFVLCTAGPGGLDASPRGDPKGFVRVFDAKTLLVPERRGNNRIDSLRNLIADPRVALLFLIPGVGETLRSRAVVRSDLWNPAGHIERASLPTPGKILSDASAGKIDAGAYDRELPGRVKATLY